MEAETYGDAGAAAEEVEEPQEETCPVCISALAPTDAARVVGCGHGFCAECLTAWCRAREAPPPCPVCRLPVKAYTLAGERLAPPCREECGGADGGGGAADLDCLDHGYFIVESGRLLQRAEALQDRLCRDAFGCGRRDRGAEQALCALSDAVASIQALRAELGRERPFEPSAVLAQLYALNDTVVAVQEGAVVSSPAGAAEPRRLGADDWEDAESETQFDFDEHELDNDPPPQRRGSCGNGRRGKGRQAGGSSGGSNGDVLCVGSPPGGRGRAGSGGSGGTPTGASPPAGSSGGGRRARRRQEREQAAAAAAAAAMGELSV